MKIVSSFALLLLASLSGPALHARVDLLLIPPADPVPNASGLTFTLHLNNPTAFPETVSLPPLLKAGYASDQGHRTTLLALADGQERAFTVLPMTRRAIVVRLTEPLESSGRFVSLRLTDPESNAIMFELHPVADARGRERERADPPDSGSPAPISPTHDLDLTNDLDAMRRHISVYDPIYFAVGWRERLNARFQFSFKYRVFEPAVPGEPLPLQLARALHVAYTQTSIWDLEAFSKPFYDSTYKPTAFLSHDLRFAPASKWLLSLQAGVQHESNGKGGGPAPLAPATGLSSPTTAQRHPSDTRSLNTFYVAAKTRWTDDDGLFLEAGARAINYFQIDENPDIARYRGYLEVSLNGGYDRGFQLSAHLRGHPSGHGSAEFNATWPANETPLFKYLLPRTLGGYAQIQYFNGYGESLLDYDVRRRDQLRFGLMIVR